MFTVVGAVSLAAGAVGGSALRGAGAASKEAGWLGKAAKVLGNGCGGKPGNSFAGDTQVWMADGSTKRIDEIKLGDQVLATDPESGESGAHEVVATIIGEGIKFLEDIEVDGGKIAATDKHPFWLADQRRWVNAEDLTVGSALQTSAGTRVQVTAIKERIVVQRVHNLTVDGIHTYYVMAGNTPVLVHNEGGWTVPDDYVIVRGGQSPMPGAGEVFSGSMGTSVGEAGAGVPHGSIRVTTAGAIRAAGGTVTYAPEPTAGGAMNYNHVNVSLGERNPFGEVEANPVPKAGRLAPEALGAPRC
ncbi:polymorphic toxin-type HINT domain-containing protein [Lentzea sp. NPDC004789]